MRFENPTKWELFLDGFRNVLYILDCYDGKGGGDYYDYSEDTQEAFEDGFILNK